MDYYVEFAVLSATCYSAFANVSVGDQREVVSQLVRGVTVDDFFSLYRVVEEIFHTYDSVHVIFWLEGFLLRLNMDQLLKRARSTKGEFNGVFAKCANDLYYEVPCVGEAKVNYLGDEQPDLTFVHQAFCSMERACVVLQLTFLRRSNVHDGLCVQRVSTSAGKVFPFAFFICFLSVR